MDAALAPGFRDAALDSQRVFRAVMDAMARPGLVVPLAVDLEPPPPLTPELAALALCLADHDAPLWLDERLAAAPAVAAFLTFHTGAAILAGRREAAFALAASAGHAPPLSSLALGTDAYPDRSTTLLLAVERLEEGAGLTLEGPGIKGRRGLLARPLPDGLARQLRDNHALFPRGVDLVLAGPGRLAALPRSVRIIGEAWAMYVAVKGGEEAIDNAHRLLADRRRGDRAVPDLSADQIDSQLALAVDRVMAEGSLYDRSLAALAVKQARGDLIEAIFLLRAFRTTLPRFGASEPLDTGAMTVERRVSATFKDLPGGQVLGPTFDYTHRLIDFALAAEAEPERPAEAEADPDAAMPRVVDILGEEGLIERHADGSEAPVGDITRAPLDFPAGRDLRLQALARGDEGFLLSLAYSTQRGFGRTHPFVGEIRFGEVEVSFVPEELGFAVPLGRVALTECQMVNQFHGSAETPPQFTRGYGLVFGQSERKAMAMALVDRALRAGELGEERGAPAQDEEFVLSHCDNVQATGFVEHLKLPHYVDFQAELELLRRLRAEHAARRREGAAASGESREAAE